MVIWCCGNHAILDAENKIAESALLIKSFGTPVEVLMYYQNDWTRTWYNSGVLFEEHENLLLHDTDGKLVISPIEYDHQFYAYDFSVVEAQMQWVNACMVLVEKGICDGVFVDGYRGPAWRFELLENCTAEFQTRWIHGMYNATKALAARLGPDRALFNNPYSAAR
jgi:hypothetical protein